MTTDLEVAVERVLLPRSRCIYEIARPVVGFALLALTARDPARRVTYWARPWPSGIALADAIAQQPGLVRGQRVLELGCGLGVTASAAVAAGADLTVADLSPDALALCQANARRNAGNTPEARQFDWRQPEAALAALAAERFSVVLAADVLYDLDDVEPLLAILEHLMIPRGLLWLAEPGRPAAHRFLTRAGEEGWQSSSEEWPVPWARDQETVVVTLHQLRRAE